MTILQIHKYFWHRDGASNYALYLSELLRKHKHTVIPFAVKQSQNISTPYEKYFVRDHDLAHPDQVSLREKIAAVSTMFYSFEAKKNITQLLHDVGQVDIAHLHNIYHHISPSILPVLKKRGVKIVMTLHDYKLLCPNYTMFHHGQVHEEDARGGYLSCVGNKCMKDSRAQSAIVTAEMIWHHKIMKYYERYVDTFIAPSRFMMNICLRFGWDEKKFVHIPHPIDTTSFSVAETDKGYIAYAGRLSEEKGLHLLVDAATYMPHIPIKIIGDGPLFVPLQRRVASEGIDNISFTGFQTGDELHASLRGSRVLVLPSIWYENYPLSILEAKAMGKIIIGSNIGGIPELLPADMLADPGNASELAERLQTWYNTPLSSREEKGKELRQSVLQENDPERHVNTIEALYRSL